MLLENITNHNVQDLYNVHWRQDIQQFKTLQVHPYSNMRLCDDKTVLYMKGKI